MPTLPKPDPNIPPMVRTKRGTDPQILAKQEAEAARKKKVEEEYAAKLEAENKRKRQNDAKTLVKHAAFYENKKTKKIMCLAGEKKDGLWHPDSKKLRAEFEASAAASKPRERREENRKAAKARKRTGKQAPPPRWIAAPPPPPKKPKKPASKPAPPPPKKKPSKKPSSKKPAGRRPLAQLPLDEAPRTQEPRAPKKRGAACEAPGAARQQRKKPASEPSWAQPLRFLQRVNELSPSEELQKAYELDLRESLATRQLWLTKPTGKYFDFFNEVADSYEQLFRSLRLPAHAQPQLLVPISPGALTGANNCYGELGLSGKTYREAMARVEEDASLTLKDLEDVYNMVASKNGLLGMAICALCGFDFEERHLRVLCRHFRFRIILDDGGASCSEAAILMPTPIASLFTNDSDVGTLERFIGTARLRYIKTLIGNACALRTTAEQACVRPALLVPNLERLGKVIDEGSAFDGLKAQCLACLAQLELREKAKESEG